MRADSRAWLALALFGATAAVTAAPWQSRLYPADPESGRYQRPVVQFGGRRWRLPDFSYTGFALGEQPPGTGVPCRDFRLSGDGDFAAMLQQAINAAGNAGGGVVRIPAGRYVLRRSVSVPFDRVAIVGQGSGRTVIEVPASYVPTQPGDEGVFTLGKPIGGWHKGWVDQGRVLGAVVGAVEAGSSRIRVGPGPALAPGDWLVLQQYFWPAFSRRHSGGKWAAYDGFPAKDGNREASFAYLRRVQSVDGSSVVLDAPIPRRLDPVDNPIRLRAVDEPEWVAPRHTLGLSGVRIEFAPNANGPGGRPAGAGVHLEGVRDAFVYDVQVWNAPRYGMRLDHAARVSLRRVGVVGVQDYGGGGYGYGIAIAASQGVLVDESYIEDTRHGITLRSPLSSDVVITNTESAASREGGDDLHHGYTHQVLWDAHRLTWGTALHAIYRGGDSLDAHETNGSQVLWNVRGDGHRGGWYGGSIQLNPAADGWNIVVGSGGRHSVWDTGRELGQGQLVPPQRGFAVGRPDAEEQPGSRNANVLYEGLHQPDLTPASLYRAQWQQRLGRETMAAIAECVAPAEPGALLRRYRDSPWPLIFDSDHLGFTPAAGHGCERCDLDSAEAAWGDGQGLRMQMTASDWAIGAEFRGPALITGRYQSLSLRLRPSRAGYALRLRLAYDGYPEGRTRAVGDARIDGLAPGRWTQVVVPMSDFGPGTFNSLELRSAGADSAQEVWIDDIELIPAAGDTP